MLSCFVCVSNLYGVVVVWSFVGRDLVCSVLSILFLWPIVEFGCVVAFFYFCLIGCSI